MTLDVFPTSRFMGRAQMHVLSFLGIPPHPVMVYNGWARTGCKYSGEYLLSYVRQVHELGGVVSLDMALFRDGSLDPAQTEAVKRLKEL